MGDFTKNFLKIIPSLRESTMELINTIPLKGKLMMIPCRAGEIEVFIHKSSRENAPLLFEFHGGGFVLGDARKDDHLRETIKKALDINVVGVNYRKAPEYPYPAAVEDSYDVLKYFYKNAEVLQIDKTKFFTLGFSAGANLATVMAILSKEKKEFTLAGQILHYPYLDALSEPQSKERHPADLPEEVMKAFIELYSGKENLKDVTISPFYATKEQLCNTARAALFMAGEDALCAEGIIYADKLVKAGVKVASKVIPNAHHGYMEDLFNRPCYDALPEDTKAVHHENIAQIAEKSMKDTIATLKLMIAQ